MPRRSATAVPSVRPASSTPSPSGRRKASGAAPPSASAGASSASAAGPSVSGPRMDASRRWAARSLGTLLVAAPTSRADRAPGGDGRDPRRGGHAGPDRRVHRRPAHEGRDGRRADRPARRHARRRRAGRPAADGPTSSTSSAPAATAPTPSTSRPWPPSWSPAPAARVCKHGNRAASSSTRLGRPARGARRAHRLRARRAWPAAWREAGIGFCFAPRFHPAMRHAGPTRRELGVPTVFNFLGPLANPAGVRRLMIGVGDAGDGRAHGRRAGRPGAPSGRWSSTATTGSTSSRPRPRRTVVELRDGEVDDLRPSTRPTLGLDAGARSAAGRAATPATNAALARRGAGRRAGSPPRHRPAQRRRRPRGRPVSSTTSPPASTTARGRARRRSGRARRSIALVAASNVATPRSGPGRLTRRPTRPPLTDDVGTDRGRRQPVTPPATGCVAAAAEVFAEKGYDRAGVQEIARRAGFTTGAIYGRFRGKAELLAAAIEAQSDDEFEQLFAEHRFEGDGHRHPAPPSARTSSPRSSTTARPCCSRRSSPPAATPSVATLLRQVIDERDAAAHRPGRGGQAHRATSTPTLDTLSIVRFCHAVGFGFLLFGAVELDRPGPEPWEVADHPPGRRRSGGGELDGTPRLTAGPPLTRSAEPPWGRSGCQIAAGCPLGRPLTRCRGSTSSRGRGASRPGRRSSSWCARCRRATRCGGSRPRRAGRARGPARPPRGRGRR